MLWLSYKVSCSRRHQGENLRLGIGMRKFRTVNAPTVD